MVGGSQEKLQGRGRQEFPKNASQIQIYTVYEFLIIDPLFLQQDCCHSLRLQKSDKCFLYQVMKTLWNQIAMLVTQPGTALKATELCVHGGGGDM